MWMTIIGANRMNAASWIMYIARISGTENGCKPRKSCQSSGDQMTSPLTRNATDRMIARMPQSFWPALKKPWGGTSFLTSGSRALDAPPPLGWVWRCR